MRRRAEGFRGDRRAVARAEQAGTQYRLPIASRTRPVLSLKRLLAALVALMFGAYAASVLLSLLRRGFEPIAGMLFLGPATVAVLCGWFALRGHIEATRARIRFVLIGGLVLGALGFVAGFFGPLVFAPDANQGPLLGIFVTGPLGFVVGCVLAYLYMVSRRSAPGSAGSP